MREAVRWGLGAFIVLRLISTAAALASLAILPFNETVSVPGYEPAQMNGLSEGLFGVWLRADALWYLKIAEQGYGPELGTFAFFPLFPMLTALVQPLFFGRELYAAMFVSNLAVVAGLSLFFLLVKELLDERAAKLSVFGLALFPTSFFLVAPYAESLLLALGSLSLLMSIRGQPLLAGIAGMFAALARPFGVLLAIPLAVFATRRTDEKEAVERSRLLSALGPPAGLVAWLAFATFQTGDPLLPFKVQSLWQREISFFPFTLLEGVTEWLETSATSFGPYLLFDVAVTTIFIALTVAGYAALSKKGGVSRSLALGLTLYPLAMILIALSLRFAPRPLLSLPRFVLSGFTAFIGLALLHRRAVIPLTFLSVAGLAVTTALFVAARPIF